ncbi:MAG: FtsW/RodA/SpoVE family cell cycle protein [Paludibacter sp.]
MNATKPRKKNEKAKYAITDENRQVQHGRIAIARGGVFGVMPGNSVERDFLPQAYSDFIYAIILEEMGLIGGIVVIILYLILLFRAGKIATKCASVFPALLVIGLSLMIVIQTFINMSVASSLIPVTGQPLPLISRGGTAILITCVYFGIILGITRQIKNEQPYEEEPELPVDTLPVVELENL